MRASRKAIAVSAAALSIGGFAAFSAAPAFADTCAGKAAGTCSTAAGSVTVGTSLTLSITSGASFAVNAVPGTATNGVPPTVVNISTNDASGYTLLSYMDDAIPTQLDTGTNSFDNAVPAFTATGNRAILDQDWSVAVGGGAAQAFPAAPLGGTQSQPVQPTLTLATANHASAGSGDNYSSQLALTVPGSQSPGAYAGGVSFLATGV